MNPKRDAFRESLKAWVQENRPDWLDERPTVDWMSELKSEATKKKVRGVFPMFMGFIEMGPQEMYDKRVDNLQSKDPKERNFFERNLKRFAAALFKAGYSPRSIRAAYVVTVQSFFAHNYMPLKFPRGAFSFDSKETKTKNPPTNDEVSAMFKIADMEDRLLLHFLYQYGMSPVDVSKIKIGDLPVGNATEEEEFHYWEYIRDKTNVRARTALNPELVFTYKALMTRRGWPSDGWVFETSRGGRLEQRYIRDRIGALASKVGVECNPKDFRDSFNEVCLESGMKQEIKDSLMGHKRAGARGAYSISRKAILEAYKKAFPELSINGGLRKSKKNLEEILSAITVAMLANNPTQEFIALIEQAYGLDVGSIKSMLADRMTMDQMRDRLMEKLTQAQKT